MLYLEIELKSSQNAACFLITCCFVIAIYVNLTNARYGVKEDKCGWAQFKIMLCNQVRYVKADGFFLVFFASDEVQ